MGVHPPVMRADGRPDARRLRKTFGVDAQPSLPGWERRLLEGLLEA